MPGSATMLIEHADRTGIFRRHGLNVVRTEGRDLAAFTAGLGQDQYDIALSVPTMVLAAAARGLDVQVVGALQRSTPTLANQVLVTRDGEIDSLTQLRGKTIAVPAVVGQVTDALYYLLQRRGIHRTELQFVVLAAGITDQLRAGQIDAAVVGAFALPRHAGQGFRFHQDPIALAVHEASEGAVDSAITFVFAATPRYAREQAGTVRAFRSALNEARVYLEAHEAERRTLMEKWAGVAPDIANTTYLLPWQIEVQPRDLAPYVTISRAVGTIETEPNLDELVWQDSG
jgi:NitT/TauT family transport system substrate-binding protein